MPNDPVDTAKKLTQIIKNSIQTLGTFHLNSPAKQKIKISNDLANYSGKELSVYFALKDVIRSSLYNLTNIHIGPPAKQSATASDKFNNYSAKELSTYFALKDIIRSSLYNLINYHLGPSVEKQTEKSGTSIDTLIRMSLDNIIKLKIGQSTESSLDTNLKNKLDEINRRRSLNQELKLARSGSNNDLHIQKIEGELIQMDAAAANKADALNISGTNPSGNVAFSGVQGVSPSQPATQSSQFNPAFTPYVASPVEQEPELQVESITPDAKTVEPLTPSAAAPLLSRRSNETPQTKQPPQQNATSGMQLLTRHPPLSSQKTPVIQAKDSTSTALLSRNKVTGIPTPSNTPDSNNVQTPMLRRNKEPDNPSVNPANTISQPQPIDTNTLNSPGLPIAIAATSSLATQQPQTNTDTDADINTNTDTVSQPQPPNSVGLPIAIAATSSLATQQQKQPTEPVSQPQLLNSVGLPIAIAAASSTASTDEEHYEDDFYPEEIDEIVENPVLNEVFRHSGKPEAEVSRTLKLVMEQNRTKTLGITPEESPKSPILDAFIEAVIQNVDPENDDSIDDAVSKQQLADGLKTILRPSTLSKPSNPSTPSNPNPPSSRLTPEQTEEIREIIEDTVADALSIAKALDPIQPSISEDDVVNAAKRVIAKKIKVAVSPSTPFFEHIFKRAVQMGLNPTHDPVTADVLGFASKIQDIKEDPKKYYENVVKPNIPLEPGSPLEQVALEAFKESMSTDMLLAAEMDKLRLLGEKQPLSEEGKSEISESIDKLTGINEVEKKKLREMFGITDIPLKPAPEVAEIGEPIQAQERYRSGLKKFKELVRKYLLQLKRGQPNAIPGETDVPGTSEIKQMNDLVAEVVNKDGEMSLYELIRESFDPKYKSLLETNATKYGEFITSILSRITVEKIKSEYNEDEMRKNVNNKDIQFKEEYPFIKLSLITLYAHIYNYKNLNKDKDNTIFSNLCNNIYLVFHYYELQHETNQI